MRGVLQSFAYILKRRTATAPEYAGPTRKKKKRTEGERKNGGKQKYFACNPARRRREGKNGWVNEESEKSRDVRNVAKCVALFIALLFLEIFLSSMPMRLSYILRVK